MAGKPRNDEIISGDHCLITIGRYPVVSRSHSLRPPKAPRQPVDLIGNLRLGRLVVDDEFGADGLYSHIRVKLRMNRHAAA